MIFVHIEDVLYWMNNLIGVVFTTLYDLYICIIHGDSSYLIKIAITKLLPLFYTWYKTGLSSL